MSINRRRDPRYSAQLSVTVLSIGASGDAIAFTTKNISESGILVQSPSDFTGKVGDVFKLTLYLNKSHANLNIHFSAKIVHQDTSDHIHGMQITSIETNEKEKLSTFIDQIAEREAPVP